MQPHDPGTMAVNVSHYHAFSTVVDCVLSNCKPKSILPLLSCLSPGIATAKGV